MSLYDDSVLEAIGKEVVHVTKALKKLLRTGLPLALGCVLVVGTMPQMSWAAGGGYRKQLD